MATGVLANLFRKLKPREYLRGFIQGIVPNPGKVLDLPAGKGTETRMLLELGYEVVPADYYPESYELDEPACQRCDWTQPFPWADGQFDGILCREGIEHIECQAQFLRECSRVLKPGGWLIITTPNLLNLRSRVAHVFTGGRSFKSYVLTENVRFGAECDLPYHPHVFLINYFQLRYLLAEAGMHIRRAAGYPYSPSAVLLFGLLAPLTILFTRLKLRQSKWNRKVPRISRQVARDVLSADLLFGKTLYLCAVKVGPGNSLSGNRTAQ